MKLFDAQQLTTALVSDAVLDAAFAWLCRQRAAGTWARFADRAPQLYEQDGQRPKGHSRLGAYVVRWRAWSGGGLTAIGPNLTRLRVGAGGFGALAVLPVQT